ncbi:hypothetical protein ACHQM5_010440 [Ranunculus cassubicifolius]
MASSASTCVGQLTGPPFKHKSSKISNDASPPMGLTENNSATYLSSGSSCLDFFFSVVPNTPPIILQKLLKEAWKQDPLTTFKLICNLRGVRGTGKSDKEGFLTAALWLHERHPKTLALNLKTVSQFGYLKDMPEILYRLIEGPEVRSLAKEERKKIQRESKRKQITRKRKRELCKKAKKEHNNRDKMCKRCGTEIPREEREEEEKKKMALISEKAKVLRDEKNQIKVRKAIHKYKGDVDYRLLHDKVSDLFAELLISDMEFYKTQDFKKISLASKWCPSLDSSFDRSTLVCESIARRVFPRHSYPEYNNVEEAHYAYRVRDRLRKEVLVPLRKTLELPEVYMSSKEWNTLPYNRVASVAMKNYTDIFAKHDKERFQEYLDKVKSGDAKIAAGALLPHQIIASLGKNEDCKEVAELQWKRMIDDLSKIGKLKNCLAICDVSGSMAGTPMEVAVALGLVISELSEDPWKGKVMTFSDKPKLHIVNGETLEEKVSFVKNMNWNMNTDFQRVFDRILEVAVNGKLSKEQMIKRIFVFSDMEFDQASTNNWETDYKVIKRKFKKSGYESVIPEIVFWNLRDSESVPVTKMDKGVAMVSGFSKNMVKMFLDGEPIVNPLAVMDKAISGDLYDKLVIFD